MSQLLSPIRIDGLEPPNHIAIVISPLPHGAAEPPPVLAEDCTDYPTQAG